MPLAKFRRPHEHGLTPVLKPVQLRRAIAMFLIVAALGFAQEKVLTISSPQGGFVVTVLEREGKEYVSLFDILQPLGATAARQDGDKWKLRFDSTESEFRSGQSKAKLRGKNIDLAGPFLIENGRGLIPVHALAPVLAQLLPTIFDFHEAARRLLIGPRNEFSALLVSGNPAQLVFHFTAPVNPSISTEPGRLRIVFTRDPVASVAATQKFDDRIITSASYSEANGAAELTVNGTAPLMATFSDGNRTITVTPAPREEAARNSHPAAPATPPPATATAPASPIAQPPPAETQAPSRPRFLVVIDPAHGGGDRGAQLSPTLVEKDLTLAWARRLRWALDKDGVSAVLLRDADANLSAEERAMAANAARPSVFISLHVDNTGSGVGLYTARLAATNARAAGLLPWDSAQSAFLDSSRFLAGSVATELTKHDVPHTAVPALLRPLSSVAGAAIAIEVSASPDVNRLSSPQYQQLVCGAIADGIVAMRGGPVAMPGSAHP